MVCSTRLFLYVLPCVILFLCFSVLLALRLPHLGKRELIVALFVRLFDLRFFVFLPLGVWKGLRFVIVALPGLFSYLFLSFYPILIKFTKQCKACRDLLPQLHFSPTLPFPLSYMPFNHFKSKRLVFIVIIVIMVIIYCYLLVPLAKLN